MRKRQNVHYYFCRYQLTWKDLHDNSESAARQAEEVDSQITKLYVHYDRQCEIMTRLHEGIAGLPVILNQLQELTDVLANLEEEYDKVEAALVYLEDVCEEAELQQAKVVDCQKLAKYQTRKKEEMEKLKIQLAKEHAKSVESVEKKRNVKLKERQEAFQEAFKEDVDYYREHGRLDRVSVSSTDSGKKTDLADFKVEEDAGILDEFLASDEITPSTEDASATTTGRIQDTFSDEENLPVSVQSNDDLDPEGDYFEDDLAATHGDPYLESEENTEESDLEKIDSDTKT
ncbi:hypothetical protein FSP39_025508 [Pinctada imbricata]|uniref:Uncharacterized protein n=1 Tax=Pinctada imbricata TaxID=66713 RepID=A0AA89BQ19_PINIB|nr:hypothetical protein FSP39_025508 [Pinctada imbricata]